MNIQSILKMRVVVFAAVLLLLHASNGAEVVDNKLDAVVELDKDSFWQHFEDIKETSTYSLVEFYASWCPHCKRFQPTYDKIGEFFNEDPRPTPLLTVARIDCAEQENFELCNEFNVNAYPTVYVGETQKFLDLGKFESVYYTYINWVIEAINLELGTNYIYEGPISNDWEAGGICQKYEEQFYTHGE